METGKKIKILRLLAGSGQLELAKELGMKAATHVNRWEQGGAIPRTNMLQRLGGYLGVCWPWLHDSDSDFCKENYMHFRPLSPFVPYTARWRALLQRDIAELLPELFHELNLNSIWGFQAPCKGGFVVAVKPGFALLITCLPELYMPIERTLPSVKQVMISDSYYAEQLFFETSTQEILKQCGAEYVVLEKKISPPPVTNIKVEVKASAAAEINHLELKKIIQDQIDSMIAAAGLFEANVSIGVTASRDASEIILDLVSDPVLRQLAMQLNEPIK